MVIRWATLVLGAVVLAGCGRPTPRLHTQADRTQEEIRAALAEMFITNVTIGPTGDRAIVQTDSGSVSALSMSPGQGHQHRRGAHGDARRNWLVSLHSRRAEALPVKGGLIALTWSPDGRTVAYLDDEARLVALDLASGRAHLVSPEGARCSPAVWSPDGKRLAFSAMWGKTREDLRFALLSAAPDGAAPARVEVEGAVPMWLWSADGKQLYFAQPARGGPARTARGSRARPLPAEATRIMGPGWHINTAIAQAPSWSPDGRHLAYFQWANDGPSVTVADRALRPVLHVPAGGQSSQHLDWCHDSSRLVFPVLGARGGKDGACIIDVARGTTSILENVGLESALPVGWIQWSGQPQLLFISGDERRLLLTAGANAPVYTFARLKEDGSPVLDLVESRPQAG